jgi:hypothetical protein
MAFLLFAMNSLAGAPHLTACCCRVQRGEDIVKAPGFFEGRVRRWRKSWLMGDQRTREGQKLLFSVWTPTGELATGHVPRPNMVAVSSTILTACPPCAMQERAAVVSKKKLHLCA